MQISETTASTAPAAQRSTARTVVRVVASIGAALWVVTLQLWCGVQLYLLTFVPIGSGSSAAWQSALSIVATIATSIILALTRQQISRDAVILPARIVAVLVCLPTAYVLLLTLPSGNGWRELAFLGASFGSFAFTMWCVALATAASVTVRRVRFVIPVSAAFAVAPLLSPAVLILVG